MNGENSIVVENLLNGNCQAAKPNEKWVTDITYLPFGTEMLYLSSIMDLYNNEIIAYEINNRQDVTLVLKTVEKAIKSQKKAEIILHSNQGAVYTSNAFQTLSKKNGITTSMSRKGNCHDNAVIEFFHSSLKSELFYAQEKQLHSTSTLKQLIHDYNEYYNTERIQEKLNYLFLVSYRIQETGSIGVFFMYHYSGSLQVLSKIFLHLFNLLQQNGRKSHLKLTFPNLSLTAIGPAHI
ncbi:IS3 family transposase [Bacillus sp. IBL03825]|uniref:IS3 family transposase n=1 Tax=Bacillus sp. IBL03825 TaxID=2953580 RepID=UPI0035BE16F6